MTVTAPSHAHTHTPYSKHIANVTPYQIVASNPHTLIKIDVPWMSMNRLCK